MLIAQRPTLVEETVSEYRSRFVMEPLEPGFGYTLGNSVRRTLLSSIPGAAVTSIRIDGVLHEFTTVPGVKEDVTELILNIKQLVVSSEHDEPVVMYLRKQGPGVVSAADIAPPAGVEVHNPDLHLATLNGEAMGMAKIAIEMAHDVGLAQARNVERMANSTLMLAPAYREGIAVAERKGDKQAGKEMAVYARRLEKSGG